MDFITNKLSYSGKTQKVLYEHDRNCWQKYIFEEMVEDCSGDRELAKINSNPKSVHSFWKITLIGGNGGKLYYLLDAISQKFQTRLSTPDVVIHEFP